MSTTTNNSQTFNISLQEYEALIETSMRQNLNIDFAYTCELINYDDETDANFILEVKTSDKETIEYLKKLGYNSN